MIGTAAPAHFATWSTCDDDSEASPSFIRMLQHIWKSRVPTTHGPAASDHDTRDDMPNTQRLLIQVLELKERQQLEDSYPRLVRALENIRQLKPNWDSYGGDPPSNETVDYAYLLISQLQKAAKDRGLGLPEPEIGPGAKGTIQLEWDIDQKAFELEFSILNNQPRYFSLVCPSEDDSTWDEDSFSLDVVGHRHINLFLSWI